MKASSPCLKHRRGAKSSVAAIRKMAAQEEHHLATFDRLVNAHHVRPTALEPFWRVAGFALGAGTALLGEKAAMACTAAVEEVIDDHYAGQLERLEDGELKEIVTQFRADEIEHRDEALARGAEQAPGLRRAERRHQGRLPPRHRTLRTDMSDGPDQDRHALLAEAAAPRRAGQDDARRLARLLAAAFTTDPVMDWISRPGAKRAEGLERFFFWLLHVRAIPFGEVWMAPSGGVAAVWLPPDVPATAGGLIEQMRLLPMFLRLCGFPRLMRGQAMADAMDKHHPHDPHYYLAFIAVAPRLQGLGLGSTLLDATLEADRRDGRPCLSRKFQSEEHQALCARRLRRPPQYRAQRGTAADRDVARWKKADRRPGVKRLTDPVRYPNRDSRPSYRADSWAESAGHCCAVR